MKTNKDFCIGAAVAVLIFALAIGSTATKTQQPQAICCSLRTEVTKR